MLHEAKAQKWGDALNSCEGTNPEFYQNFVKNGSGRLMSLETNREAFSSFMTLGLEKGIRSMRLRFALEDENPSPGELNFVPFLEYEVSSDDEHGPFYIEFETHQDSFKQKKCGPVVSVSCKFLEGAQNGWSGVPNTNLRARFCGELSESKSNQNQKVGISEYRFNHGVNSCFLEIIKQFISTQKVRSSFCGLKLHLGIKEKSGCCLKTFLYDYTTILEFLYSDDRPPEAASIIANNQPNVPDDCPTKDGFPPFDPDAPSDFWQYIHPCPPTCNP